MPFYTYYGKYDRHRAGLSVTVLQKLYYGHYICSLRKTSVSCIQDVQTVESVKGREGNGVRDPSPIRLRVWGAS